MILLNVFIAKPALGARIFLDWRGVLYCFCQLRIVSMEKEASDDNLYIPFHLVLPGIFQQIPLFSNRHRLGVLLEQPLH